MMSDVNHSTELENLTAHICSTFDVTGCNYAGSNNNVQTTIEDVVINPNNMFSEVSWVLSSIFDLVELVLNNSNVVSSNNTSIWIFALFTFPLHLTVLGLIIKHPLRYWVDAQLQAFELQRLKVVGVTFFCFGTYMVAVSIVQTFGLSLFWGAALVGLGINLLSEHISASVKHCGLVKYLDINKSTRQWLFETTLLETIQQDRMLQTVNKIGKSMNMHNMHLCTNSIFLY